MTTGLSVVVLGVAPPLGDTYEKYVVCAQEKAHADTTCIFPTEGYVFKADPCFFHDGCNNVKYIKYIPCTSRPEVR